MKILRKFASVLLFAAVTCSAEYRVDQVLSDISQAPNIEVEDLEQWRYCLENLAQPTADEVRSYMREVSESTGVPEEILKAIAYVENNWLQIGPSVDRGWGMMHLVENSLCNTLGEAAALIGVTPQALKSDWKLNVRAAAELIASYAENKPETLQDWFPALSRFTGLNTENLRNMQARTYYSVISKGVTEYNLLNQKVSIRPVRIDMDGIDRMYRDTQETDTDETPVTPDEIPGAVLKLTKHNFLKDRIHPVDTWVIHYIGVGTYAGAISWFHNPEAKACAHFVIRQSDGEITQVVDSDDTAWHCTRKKAPKGGMNNPRSIGVEHEVTSAHPEWWQSKPMLRSSAKLARFYAEKFKIPERYGCPGIIGHKDMNGCETDCPGDYPLQLWWKYYTGTAEVNSDPVNYKPLTKPALICKDGVNVRKGPSTEESIVGTYNTGEKVHLTGQYKEWYSLKVDADGKQGYVRFDLVNF